MLLVLARPAARTPSPRAECSEDVHCTIILAEIDGNLQGGAIFGSHES